MQAMKRTDHQARRAGLAPLSACVTGTSFRHCALQEAAATSEALEAERAAKFAADAEARELQRVLEEVRRSFAEACLCSAMLQLAAPV